MASVKAAAAWVIIAVMGNPGQPSDHIACLAGAVAHAPLWIGTARAIVAPRAAAVAAAVGVSAEVVIRVAEA